MLNFFRRIRQKLLAENRFSKYLIYAAGEILLVVIGILIALQVNNWNEQRKDYNRQRGHLLLIRDEMQNNLEALSVARDQLFGVLQKQRELLSVIDSASNDISESELSGLIAASTNFSTKFEYENGALTELISTGGLKDIANKKIRNFLASFEGRLQRVLRQEAATNAQFDKCNIFIEKYGDFRRLFDEVGANQWVGIPKSPDNNSNRPLLMSQEFENLILITLALGYFLHADHYNELEQEIQRLIKMIDEDLGLKSKAIALTLPGFKNAKTVAVIGEFNSWNDSIGLMTKTNKGWKKELELFPGNYEYKFVIDKNKYMADPNNWDSVYIRSDNAYNSVLSVE